MEPYRLLQVLGAVLLCTGALLACVTVLTAKRLEVRKARADLAGLARFEPDEGQGPRKSRCPSRRADQCVHGMAEPVRTGEPKRTGGPEPDAFGGEEGTTIEPPTMVAG